MANRRKKVTIEEATEMLMDTDPIILETDPKMKNRVKLGTKVVVCLPVFGRAVKELQRKQFECGVVKKFGQVALEDGTILNINKAEIIPLTFEVKEMLRKGILMGGSKY